MKTQLLIAMGIAFLLLVVACTTKKKVAYEFPIEMKSNVQQQYAVLCEKGQVLYSINCAKCHNTGKHQQIIPDFKPEQLVGYTLRITNSKHENNLTDTLITEEELGLIMTFLSYKKKNK